MLFFLQQHFISYLHRKEKLQILKKTRKKCNKITVYRLASLNNVSYFVFYNEIMTDNKIKIETKNESYLTFCLRDLFYFQPT